MTTAKVNWSEKDQQYWINDVDGEVLWFDSSLDAAAALREVELKGAALGERAAIVTWLKSMGAHAWTLEVDLADKIEAGKHLRVAGPCISITPSN
jgi:hypothetical protein